MVNMSVNLKCSDLAGGVKLCVAPSDRFKTSVVSINMAMELGGKIEERAVLAYLLRRCSARYGSLTELNRKLAELYGAILSSAVIKNGESQILIFSITSVNDKFAIDDESISEECAKLLLDIIFEPKMENGLFCEEDVELEKRLLLERIDSEFSEKRTYALHRAEEEMCKNEAYGQRSYGKAERIRELTCEDITIAWKELLEKSLIQINVVGSGCEDSVREEVIKRFENIDRSSLSEIRTEFVVSAKEENYVEEKQPVKQAKLVIGLRAGMTDRQDNNYALHVMTDMFGGGPYSKLFMNVREKMSLCYYCSARFVRNKGIIMIQSGIEEENEQKAIDAIKKQLKDMQDGNFTQEDLEKSINGLSDSYLTVEDTPDGIDRWYAKDFVDGETMTPEEYVENISKITVEQVQAAAQAVTVDTVYMLKSNGESEE